MERGGPARDLPLMAQMQLGGSGGERVLVLKVDLVRRSSLDRGRF